MFTYPAVHPNNYGFVPGSTSTLTSCPTQHLTNEGSNHNKPASTPNSNQQLQTHPVSKTPGSTLAPTYLAGTDYQIIALENYLQELRQPVFATADDRTSGFQLHVTDADLLQILYPPDSKRKDTLLGEPTQIGYGGQLSPKPGVNSTRVLGSKLLETSHAARRLQTFPNESSKPTLRGDVKSQVALAASPVKGVGHLPKIDFRQIRRTPDTQVTSHPRTVHVTKATQSIVRSDVGVEPVISLTDAHPAAPSFSDLSTLEPDKVRMKCISSPSIPSGKEDGPQDPRYVGSGRQSSTLRQTTTSTALVCPDQIEQLDVAMRDVISVEDNANSISMQDPGTINNAPKPKSSLKKSPTVPDVSRKITMQKWVRILHEILEDVEETQWNERITKHRDDMNRILMIPKDGSKIPYDFALAVKILPRRGDVHPDLRSQLIGRLQDYKDWDAYMKSPGTDGTSKKARIRTSAAFLESIEQFKTERKKLKGKGKMKADSVLLPVEVNTQRDEDIEAQTQVDSRGSDETFARCTAQCPSLPSNDDEVPSACEDVKRIIHSPPLSSQPAASSDKSKSNPGTRDFAVQVSFPMSEQSINLTGQMHTTRQRVLAMAQAHQEEIRQAICMLCECRDAFWDIDRKLFEPKLEQGYTTIISSSSHAQREETNMKLQELRVLSQQRQKLVWERMSELTEYHDSLWHVDEGLCEKEFHAILKETLASLGSEVMGPLNEITLRTREVLAELRLMGIELLDDSGKLGMYDRRRSRVRVFDPARLRAGHGLS